MSIDDKIKKNVGIVYAQLHKFNLEADEDAFSYGLEALWHAIETFDESKGYSFSTYAYACVYNGLAMYCRKKPPREASYEDLLEKNQLPTYYIDTGEEVRDILDKVKIAIFHISNREHRAILKYWASTNFEAKQSEIAEKFGISQAQVSRIINKFRKELRNEYSRFEDGL